LRKFPNNNLKLSDRWQLMCLCPSYTQAKHAHTCMHYRHTHVYACTHIYKKSSKDTNPACLISLDIWKPRWNATESRVELEISALHIHNALFSLYYEG
ncbi:mCG144774, partial [Mus musculus]